MDKQNSWLSWAIELQSLAQAGLRVTAAGSSPFRTGTSTISQYTLTGS